MIPVATCSTISTQNYLYDRALRDVRYSTSCSTPLNRMHPIISWSGAAGASFTLLKSCQNGRRTRYVAIAMNGPNIRAISLRVGVLYLKCEVVTPAKSTSP